MNELPQLYIAVIMPSRKIVENTTVTIETMPFVELSFGLREDVENQCLINARKAYPASAGWRHGVISTFHVRNEKLAQLVKDTSSGIETFKQELGL